MVNPPAHQTKGAQAHTECMELMSRIYKALKHKGVAWICPPHKFIIQLCTLFGVEPPICSTGPWFQDIFVQRTWLRGFVKYLSDFS